MSANNCGAYNHALTSDNWPTPDQIFDEINHIYNFDLDLAADEQNKKCENFFTKDQDALSKSWMGHKCWLNPPYSATLFTNFMYKCAHTIYEASLFPKGSLEARTMIAALIPAKTENFAWQAYVAPYATVYFFKGRITFVGASNNATFGSALVLYLNPANLFNSLPVHEPVSLPSRYFLQKTL